jgi:hypothetical protein
MANGGNLTQTQIAREAPFLEDARRRLLDTIFPTGTYTQEDKDKGQIPPGFDVGEIRQLDKEQE